MSGQDNISVTAVKASRLLLPPNKNPQHISSEVIADLVVIPLTREMRSYVINITQVVPEELVFSDLPKP